MSGLHVLADSSCIFPHEVHLSSNFLHEGVKLLEEVIALMEEGELGVHEGKELQTMVKEYNLK